MGVILRNKQRVEQELKSSLQAFLSGPPQRFVVAYSGGVDSQVLLHSLAALAKNHPQHHYSAIHIHHGLSPYADDWQQHCEQSCAQLGIEFKWGKVSLDLQRRKSLEALAREARYKKLEELAPPNAMILLAQHQDDQIETFILQLKRGAGPKGLSAMAACQIRSSGRVLLRPLLNVSRQDIMSYAREHHLSWQEDESNTNTEFDRNFLRHDIMPELLARWPEFGQAVSRSAALCAEQQSLLDEVSLQHLEQLNDQQERLKISGLKTLSVAWQNQVVRLWLIRKKIQLPNAALLNRLYSDVILAKDDANPVLRWDTWQIRRFDDYLYVLPLTEVPANVEFIIQEHKLSLPLHQGRLSLCCHTNAFSGQKVYIRYGKLSQRFKPAGEAHSKPLKQWFKLWQVEPWEREVSAQVFLQGADNNEQLLAIICKGEFILSDSVPEELHLSYFSN